MASLKTLTDPLVPLYGAEGETSIVDFSEVMGSIRRVNSVSISLYFAYRSPSKEGGVIGLFECATHDGYTIDRRNLQLT